MNNFSPDSVIEAITNSGIKYDEKDDFYNLGVDVEKIAQGVGYAVETVKEWLGLSGDAK